MSDMFRTWMDAPPVPVADTTAIPPGPPPAPPRVRSEPVYDGVALRDLFTEPRDWALTVGPPARRVALFRKPPHRPLEDDPFCTDVSFFGSGRNRLTGYAPYDRLRAPNYVPRREPRRGPYTGAAQPDGPRVNRKFGNNTRQSVMPFRRYTHMHTTGYDDDVVGSKPVPPFLDPNAAVGQGGSAAVLSAAGLTRTLGAGKSGAKHYLLDGSA